MQPSNGFTVPAIITRVSSLADKGVSIGLHTKELTPTERATIMEYHNTAGWLLFQPNKIPDAEIPKADAELEEKTPGQRLRGVLFVQWTQTGSKGTFEQFYRDQMEHFINMVKAKLQ